MGVVEVDGGCLGEVLVALGVALPQVGELCLAGDRLKTGYLASVNGRTFVSDPATPLEADDCVLILSSDMGG